MLNDGEKKIKIVSASELEHAALTSVILQKMTFLKTLWRKIFLSSVKQYEMIRALTPFVLGKCAVPISLQLNLKTWLRSLKDVIASSLKGLGEKESKNSLNS